MPNPSPKSLANLRPYQPGQSGNPAGRPQGARSKLNELALRHLLEDFTQHGQAVIARVRERKPERYLAAVVSLLPKQAQKLDSPFTDLTDDELEQLEQLLAAMRAKTVRDLNRVAPKPNHNDAPNVTASLGLKPFGLQPLQYPAAQAWRATTNVALVEEGSNTTGDGDDQRANVQTEACSNASELEALIRSGDDLDAWLKPSG